MEAYNSCSSVADETEPQYCETTQIVLILQAFYLTVTILLSLTGNAGILFLVIKFTALQYRSILVSLSVVICDLILVLFFHLPALISVASGEWIMGHIACQIFGVVGFYLIFVRWMSMAVISLDRFSFTLFPFTYPRWSKPYLISLTICAWFLPALMVAPSIAGEGVYSFRPGFSQCIIHCGDNQACYGLYVALYTSQMFVGAVLPSVLYTVMYCISCRKRRLIQMGSHNDLTDTDRITPQWSQRDKRALKTFIIVLVVLLISNMPAYLLNSIRQTIPSVYRMTPIWIHMIAADFFYAANILNPLLIIRNRDIYKAFQRLYKKQSRRLSMRTTSTSTLRRSSVSASTNNNLH